MKLRSRHSALLGIIICPLIIWALLHYFSPPASLPVLVSENMDSGKSGIDERALLIFKSSDFGKTQRSLRNLEKKGGKADHIFPPHVVIAKVPKDIEKKKLQDDNVADLVRSKVNAEWFRGMDDAARLAVSVWNKQFESAEVGEKPLISAEKGYQEGVEPEPIYDDLRYISIRPPQDKGQDKTKEIERHGEAGSPGGSQGVALAPVPAEFGKTSEYMIGSVTVGIVLPQSTPTAHNKSENWTQDREQLVISKIQTGLQWWIQRDAESAGKAQLSFVYDIQKRVPTNYEPINTCSIDCNSDGIYDEGLWIQEVMNHLSSTLGFSVTPPAGTNSADYQKAPYFYAVRSYDNYLRQKYATDWAVTVFVVDSFNDTDGRFPDNYFAYTYAGGPFTVLTYDNQNYGIQNLDAVMAHEWGHDFYALDQYGNCSTVATSGFLQVPNNNCENDNPDVVASIMRGQIAPYNSGALDYWARGQIGWWDANVNGIYDPVDFPPVVSLDECPTDCQNNGQLTTVNDLTPVFHGLAQSSQAKIDQVLFRVDSGAWLDAIPNDGQFDTSTESFNFQLSPQFPGAHVLEVKARTNFGRETQPLYRLNLNIVAPHPDVVKLIAVVVKDPSNGQTSQTNSPVGRYLHLQALGLYNDGSQEILSSALTWTNTNAGVGSLDQSGLFFGLTEGSISVTVTWAGPNSEQFASNAFGITVTPYLPIALLSQNGPVVSSGDQAGISIKGGGDNMQASVLGPAYASSTPLNIINGRIIWQIPGTGNFAGSYTITVRDQSINNQQGTIKINVPLEISPQAGNLPLDLEVSFQAQGSPGPFSWQINGESSPGIGSIDSSTGTFVGQGVGSLVITATDVSNPTLNGTNRFFLVDTGKILVKVLKANDGTPLNEARIDVQNLPSFNSNVTANSGAFLLEGLPIQPVVINIFAPGFLPYRHPSPVWPTSGSNSPAIVEVKLVPASFSLSGEVHDISGVGTKGARISVSGKLLDNSSYAGSILTDDLGQFTIGVPGAGSYALFASAKNYGNSAVSASMDIAGDTQGLSLMVLPYLYSEEEPVTKQTAIKILDWSGTLTATNTLSPVSAAGGTFSIFSDEPFSLNNGAITPSHLVSLYTPGGQDSEGSVVKGSISIINLPSPLILDYSFNVHPTSTQSAIAAVEQTMNGGVGGLVYFAEMDGNINGSVNTVNETSLFVPSGTLPANYQDQDIKVKIVKFDELSGTTLGRYSFDLQDTNGLSILLPALSLSQVNAGKRFIISMPVDPAFFDPQEFLKGNFIVQYQVSSGGPFVSDGSFKASVVGSTLIIESTHLSTWALNPALPLQDNASQGSGGGGGGGCFIATAVFGSFLEPEVVILREFRDGFLITNSLGKWLVDGYYRVSPGLAEFISHHSSIRLGVRLILYPVVGFSWMVIYGGSSWAKFFIPGMVAIFLIPFFRIRFRKGLRD